MSGLEMAEGSEDEAGLLHPRDNDDDDSQDSDDNVINLDVPFLHGDRGSHELNVCVRL